MILGNEGQKHVAVKFFGYADSDQMPIRNVIVDWGDALRGEGDSSDTWPINEAQSQTGSNSNGNFYKNHRGLVDKSGNESTTYCDEEDEWGHTSQACDPSYFNFENDYLCSQDILDNLPQCILDEERLLNAPCTSGDLSSIASNACVFQPRVFIKDNWGWCTGYCDSNPDDETTECYKKECDPTNCPSEGTSSACVDYELVYGDVIVNPWINFDGYIVVEP